MGMLIVYVGFCIGCCFIWLVWISGVVCVLLYLVVMFGYWLTCDGGECDVGIDLYTLFVLRMFVLLGLWCGCLCEVRLGVAYS